MKCPLDIVILGLSITSSWGNGHASTFRGLVKALARKGHRVLFLERDVPWYASHRDEPHPAGCRTALYGSFEELAQFSENAVEDADLVILGSYVPEGIRVGRWMRGVARGRTAFYDIDTPVTLAALDEGTAEYIDADLIRGFNCYFSFTGGPTLRRIESQYGSPMARPLYCAVDVDSYQPQSVPERWDLGYLGTYSDDRQPILDDLLLGPARQLSSLRFAVAGPQYPESINWPVNVDRISHLAPQEHPAFYGAQRFTLNATRKAMRRAGYSPSVRLFEAGACAAPVISDWWPGLDELFDVGSEMLVAHDTEDVVRLLRDTNASTSRGIGERLRERILMEHTPAVRAAQIETYFEEMSDHASTDSSRRHRCCGTGAGGFTTGMAAE